MTNVGIVKKWYNEKGFGFITGSDGVDVFAHHTDLSGQELMEGGKVQFDVTYAEGKPKAVNVSGALQPRTSRVGGDQKNDTRDIDPLVRFIKTQQRSCALYKELWQEFCDKHGGGVLDPARHRYQFLVAAIDECQRNWEVRGGQKRGMAGGYHQGGQFQHQHQHQHHQHQHQHHQHHPHHHQHGQHQHMQSQMHNQQHHMHQHQYHQQHQQFQMNQNMDHLGYPGHVQQSHMPYNGTGHNAFGQRPQSGGRYPAYM